LKFEREFLAKISEAKVRLAKAQKPIEKLRASARKARQMSALVMAPRYQN
jgi:hypothetical protein